MEKLLSLAIISIGNKTVLTKLETIIPNVQYLEENTGVNGKILTQLCITVYRPISWSNFDLQYLP